MKSPIYVKMMSNVYVYIYIYIYIYIFRENLMDFMVLTKSFCKL